MKSSEIKELTDDALFAKGLELREQLFRLRFKLALGNQDTVRELRGARKDLARIKTELRSREIQADVAAGTARGRKLSRERRVKNTARRLRGASQAR